MSRTFSVWVLEIAVLKARTAALHREGKGLSVRAEDIAYWEVWQAFNSRSEAVKARNEGTGRFVERKVPQIYWRIRKYVPEESA